MRTVVDEKIEVCGVAGIVPPKVAVRNGPESGAGAGAAAAGVAHVVWQRVRVRIGHLSHTGGSSHTIRDEGRGTGGSDNFRPGEWRETAETGSVPLEVRPKIYSNRCAARARAWPLNI